MAGRYRSSNIKFNLNDENQRITWEYLKQSSHKENGSYAKILSDAFVKTLQLEKESLGVLPEALALSILDEVRKHLSEITCNTAKEQNKDALEIRNECEDNNRNAEQEIPEAMLDYFMLNGT